MNDRNQQIRLLEALLFAASEPLEEAQIAAHLPEDAPVGELLSELQTLFENRGVNLVRVGKAWAFRTAPDLSQALKIETTTTRRLSRAAVETLAIIAYHQPVTRAEIEEIRGVSHSKGTLDHLLELGWIKPGRRRRSPGRPLNWITTPQFLDHFGLENIKDLPGIDDLKSAGLLDARPAIQAFRGIMGGDAAQAEADEADGADGELDEENDDLAGGASASELRSQSR